MQNYSTIFQQLLSFIPRYQFERLVFTIKARR